MEIVSKRRCKVNIMTKHDDIKKYSNKNTEKDKNKINIKTKVIVKL